MSGCWKAYPASSRRRGSTWALASSSPDISPSATRSAGAGTCSTEPGRRSPEYRQAEHGRAAERRVQRLGELGVRHRMRRGQVQRARDVRPVEQEAHRPDLVGERDPAHVLAAGPERYAESELEDGHQPAQRAAACGKDEAGAQVRGPDPRGPRRVCRLLPVPDEVGQESRARRRGLVRLTAVGVPVPADGRSAQQRGRRLVQPGQPGGERPGAANPAVPDLRFARGRPAPVSDPGPARWTTAATSVKARGSSPPSTESGSQADTASSGAAASSACGPGCGATPRRRRTAGQPGHLVAVAAQAGSERGADQARRARDRDFRSDHLPGAGRPGRAPGTARQQPAGCGRARTTACQRGALQRPSSDSNAPSSRRFFTVARNRAASAPSISRWS